MIISIDREYIYSDTPPFKLIDTLFTVYEDYGGRWVVDFECEKLNNEIGECLINDIVKGNFGTNQIVYEWINKPYKKENKNFNCRKL